VYLYKRKDFMISDLDKLSSGLKKRSNQEDVAERLANKIKTDPQVQRDLDRDGRARVTDEDGRIFVVRRKVAAAGLQTV
jgi:hypothetical protein